MQAQRGGVKLFWQGSNNNQAIEVAEGADIVTEVVEADGQCTLQNYVIEAHYRAYYSQNEASDNFQGQATFAIDSLFVDLVLGQK